MKKKELKSEIKNLKYKVKVYRELNNTIGEGLQELTNENITLKIELANLIANDIINIIKEDNKQKWLDSLTKGIKVIPPAEEIIINGKKAKKVTYKGNGFYDITI